MKKNIILFKSFRAKITASLIIAMVLAGGVSNFLIYRYAFDSQFSDLRDKLMKIAQVTAFTVSADEISAIPLEREGVENFQYKTVARRLAGIRRAVPSIKYIYILKKTDASKTLKFITDADAGLNDGKGPVAYPGDDYDASDFPEMLKAFGGPTADTKMARDQWGVFLSGYAPIYDRDGKAVAVLGVDMTAQDVYNVQKEMRKRAIFIMSFGIALAVFIGIFVSGGVTKRIKELMNGASRIAKGDLDHRVRVGGHDEISHLGNLFNRMSVDLKNHIEELRRTTAEKERLVREIEIARGIQQSFLPDSAPNIQGLDIAAISLPARIVGGDFYDFIPVTKNKWGFVIADVSGKGVPAALFMALSRTLMRSTAQGAILPSDAINQANNLMLEGSKTNMFVTLFYAVFDSTTLMLQYANAGHNPPLLITGADNSLILLKAQGVPLGISSDIKTTTDSITLKRGDVILFYTDGVTEAVNSDGEQFEMDRLEKIAVNSRNLPAQEIMNRVRESIRSFVGNEPQFDDITIMVLKAG